MHCKYIIAFIIIFFIPQIINSKYLQRIPLSTQSGLTTPAASCIVIDDEGYLWIGTAEGLFRSDGYHVKYFNIDKNTCPQNHSNFITRLADDHNGHLWIGTTQGLYYIDKTHGYQIHHFNSPYNKGSVSSITLDDNNTLWIAIGNSILHIKTDETLLRYIKCTWDGDGYKWVCDIKKGYKGRIYVAQCHGALCYIDTIKNQLIKLPYKSIFEPQTMAFDARRRGMWIGSWGGGLLWYNGQYTQSVSISKTNTPQLIHNNSSMIIDLQLSATGDTLWTTTMKGLEAYAIQDAGVLKSIDISSLGLPSDNQILSLMTLDKRTHDVWVAGYNPTTFAIHSINSLPQADKTWCITDIDDICYSKPYIYTWYNRKGLTVLRHYDNTILKNIYDGIHTVDAFIMASDNEGGCYFGRTANNGKHSVISHIRINDQETDSQKIKIDNICNIDGSISALCYVPETQTLWAATHNKIWRIYGKRPHLMFSTYDVNCIAVCNGQLFLGTEQGLAIVNTSGNNTRLLYPYAIKSLATQSDTCLWAGTASGDILKVDKNGMPHLLSEASLPDRGCIYHIAIDSLGHIWTQSKRFLCEYVPQTKIQRVLSNKHNQINLSYINTVCSMNNGILVGGIGGSLKLIKGSQQLESYNTLQHRKIKISMVQTDSIVVPVTDKDSLLKVKAGTSSIILHLTTLNHISPQSETYAYRLRADGNTDDGAWTILPKGQNLIYLSTLPHGRWIVEVKNANNEYIWSTPHVIIKIESLPYWWQTWWAKTLVVFAIMLSTFGGLKLWRHTKHLRTLYLNAIDKRYRIYLQSVETLITDTEESHQDFLQRAVTNVECHITDTKYNVETLASDMCMSRMTLYRRLHQQTGQSPSDFIRDIRLKHAARLIKDFPNKSVTDIAAATGFSSPAVFRRQFKAMFGVTPSEYQRTKT